MADQPIAPVAEPKVTETPVVEAPKEQPKVEQTVKEALETKPEPKMVPEAVLIEMKKENKQLAKEMKDLKKSIEEGATKKEVSADLKSLGEKYNVDPNFLEEFANTTKAEAEKEFNAKLKPLEDEKKAAEQTSKFNAVFDKTMEELPEFSKIAKRETVKALSLLPENANKTFRQILEDNFGHLVQGKRTLNPTVPRGGNDAIEIDMARATRDTEYFQQIMADPLLKKKYNEGMGKRLRL